MAAGWACGTTAGGNDDAPECIGAIDCPCTSGGGCDPGLVCIDGRCLGSPPSMTDSGGATDGSATGGGTTMGPGDTTAASLGTTGLDTSGGDPSTDDGGGPLLDVAPMDLGGPTMGCQAVDVLFAIDGSASMAEERAALAATGSFTQVIMTMESLNGGGIDYRIGVTDDDDHGFLVPPGWFDPNPWFDSSTLTAMEIADAFNGAVGQVGGIGGATTGCEHVLTSATDLVDGDLSGFVRPDALLVLVLLTDVDDYGAYDQMGGNTCGLGCTTPPPPLMDLYDTLVAAKGGDPAGVAAIVVAGDPGLAGGFNFCNQPGSCGCVEVIPGFFDCDIFHGTRLWDFATMLGANGFAGDLCAGPMSVPTSVETALTTSIDIACQNYEPEG